MKQPDITDLPGVSRETMDKLRHYHSLLLKWQEKINLISPNTVKEAWTRHFVDSAQLAPLLTPDAKTLYDLGSGAGFAGMVLAILRPDLAVTLIESDDKKCAFLHTVSRETATPVTVKNARIEAAATGLPAPDILTARALASLDALLTYTAPWLQRAPDMALIFPKGAQFRAEIAAAQKAGWTFDCIEIPSQTDPSARILSLKKVRKSSV